MQIYPPGTRIAQYEIASRPMMGGMGVVYFALDHGNDGRPVALKTFRPELLPNREARDRFLREGTAWIELGSHPHIVRCYKVEYIDPIAFLVLELIAKEQNMPDASLRSWLIPGHPLPLEQALLFALQIARGMQYATEKIPGFVHRDLKPENILVGADTLPGTKINRLRVTDFGLVKTIARGDISGVVANEEQLKPTQIQFTRGVGTPLYMAPEQWIDAPVDIFTDVYAFGCILYEMLTGEFVVDGKTITELQVAHCDNKLRPTPKNLPRDLIKVLNKCLEINPINRFSTWQELLDTLKHLNIIKKDNLKLVMSNFTLQSRNEHIHTSRSYMSIGTAYLDLGRAKAAIVYFEKAFNIVHDVGDLGGESEALGHLGKAYQDLGNAKRAIGYYEKHLSLAREIGDRFGEGKALMDLGSVYTDIGEVKAAVEYIEQGLVVMREIGNHHAEADALGIMGNICVNVNDLKKAFMFYEKQLEITRQIRDRRGEGNALGNLGVVFKEIGDLSQAIRFYEQALIIDRELGDRRGEAIDLGNLGVAYKNMGDARKAISYLEQELVIEREVGDQIQLRNALYNLGNAHMELRDARQAINHYEQSLKVAREVGHRQKEGMILGGLGNAYFQLNSFQQALNYYEQAINLAREIEDRNDVAKYSFMMAQINADLGELNLAVSQAQEAVQTWKNLGSPYFEHAQSLLARLQGKEIPYETVANLASVAFGAFEKSNTFVEMLNAVKKYPIMMELVPVLEEFISKKAPLEQRAALEKRLAWLRQIANQK
jgi:serine/threonine protein kinase/Flp pilus assembly protein TadD